MSALGKAGIINTSSQRNGKGRFKVEPQEENGVYLSFPTWAAAGGHGSWRIGSILNP